jgi:predicted CoA-binding protein
MEVGHELHTADEIDGLLARTRSVAVVGVSSDASRPSREIAEYLLAHSDWTVYLVNPNLDSVLGHTVYPTLADLPAAPGTVDVFRRREYLGEVTDQSIAVGAGALWFQLGLADDAAAGRAVAAGLDVVQDHCLGVEHRRWKRARR